jgi:2-C-methyl-D-erythritol 4-phosphate cytidylyltransferase
MTRRTVLPSPDVPDAVWTVVVAAGSGARFGGPKQFVDLGGRPVLEWSLATARAASSGVVLVAPPQAGSDGGDEPSADLFDAMVAGGTTRSESVRQGLAAVPVDARIIVVHDAARPFASAVLFEAVIGAVRDGADGAVPGVAVTDTIKQVTSDGVVVTTPDRTSLRAVQTPQAFRADVLRRAHGRASEGTDDAALVEAIGGYVVVVPGDVLNRKITVPDDLRWAREQLQSKGVG